LEEVRERSKDMRHPPSSARNAVAWTLLVVVYLSTAACAAGSAPQNGGAAQGGESTEEATREVTNANLAECSSLDPAALEQDARVYAKDEGISVDEAERRLRFQECFADDLADLERALRDEEAGTFAGLWIRRGPQHGFAVLFTRDGEQTIRPYLKGESERFRRLIEVRSGADATLAELHAAQREATRLVNELGIRAEGTGINVEKNHAVVYAADRARFKAALREAGAQLPDNVEVVDIEGQLRPE